MLRPTPQVVQLRRRGLQGQRLLPHRQPGIVEEFGARRIRVVGVGKVGIGKVVGIGKGGRVGKVFVIGEAEFADPEFWIIEFERLRIDSGLELDLSTALR